jgi:hypothetical protein
MSAPVLISDLRATNQLHLYMQGMFDNDHVVYCRYGRDYIPAISKQYQLMSNNPSFTAPMR